MKRTIRTITAGILLAVGLAFGSPVQAETVRLKTVEEVRPQVDELVAKLSLTDKINIIGGTNSFGVVAIPELGLRATRYGDASLGLRQKPGATSFPATIGLAASMNKKLAFRYGRAVGEEARHWGVDYLLGPGVNLYRVHTCGRNFEYMGADPYLAGIMGAHYINGLQSTGTGAVLKHYAVNNTDWMRCNSDSVLSERALREIYLTPFRIAIKESDPLAVMTAYNLVNGVYAGEHHQLMTEIARGEWGFQGYFMSDWRSLYDAELAFNSGLDQECPTGARFSEGQLLPLFEQGKIKQEELDRKVRSILTASLRAGIYDRSEDEGKDRFKANHPDDARAIARETMVLLKNGNNTLPLSEGKYPRIALLGAGMRSTPATGGGAAMFRKKKVTRLSIVDALSQQLPHIRFCEPVEPSPAAEGAPAANTEEGPLPAALRLEEARKLASSVDVVVIATGTNHKMEHEGRDLPFRLPQEQYDLIDAVLEVNKKVVVVNISGTGIDMSPFADRVPAILQVFFTGEHGGEIIGEVLAGKTNPSGKLPFTLGRRAEDHHWFGNYLPDGADLYEKPLFTRRNTTRWECHYNEGILLDYRWFDRKGIEPLFAFGHGLSYSRFRISNLGVSKKGDEVALTVEVENTGTRSGAEVVQVYVEDVQSSEIRPEKELKEFVKVFLQPNGKRTVSISLDQRAFSFWSEQKKRWTLEPGTFRIHVGSSSRNIAETVEVEL